VSTPRTLRLPDGVRRVTVETARGPFAALEALPAAGVAERQPALLIPGYTGSKEDFLPVLGPLAGAGRRVIAIDMRGQYESPPAADADGYDLAALAADAALIADMIGGSGDPAASRDTAGSRPDSSRPDSSLRYGGHHVHLLGHSFGGLVAQELLLAQTARIGSLALMSSGPGALTGPRAAVLRAILAELEPSVPSGLRAEVKRLWDTQMEPAAVADGVPTEIVDFLRTRMLRSCPTGLWSMARGLLACPDRTPALAASGAPLLVVYGENDDAWAPSIQNDMAQRLGAERVCIPMAAHSPAMEAPETVASILTRFWNSVETSRGRRLAGPWR
jgi:pimeloyl-ACP methyl ester carboxylesterase